MLAGFAATAFDLQPAVAAIEAVCDLGGELRRPAVPSPFGLTGLPLRRGWLARGLLGGFSQFNIDEK
jgi:hypothetical protein